MSTTTRARHQAPNPGVPHVLNLRGLRFMAAGEGGDGGDGSTNPPAGGNSDTAGGTPTGGDGFEPITTQDALNRVIGPRLERERAKFADYDDLKAKAGQVDEWQTKATALEAQLAEVPTKVTAELRTHLVALHKIDDADAELFLTATDPTTLLKQVDRLTARGGTTGPHVSREGTTTTAKPDAARETVRGLFGGTTT